MMAEGTSPMLSSTAWSQVAHLDVYARGPPVRGSPGHVVRPEDYTEPDRTSPIRTAGPTCRVRPR